MDKIIIQGGHRLKGEVDVSGIKIEVERLDHLKQLAEKFGACD